VLTSRKSRTKEDMVVITTERINKNTVSGTLATSEPINNPVGAERFALILPLDKQIVMENSVLGTEKKEGQSTAAYSTLKVSRHLKCAANAKEHCSGLWYQKAASQLMMESLEKAAVLFIVGAILKDIKTAMTQLKAYLSMTGGTWIAAISCLIQTNAMNIRTPTKNPTDPGVIRSMLIRCAAFAEEELRN